MIPALSVDGTSTSARRSVSPRKDRRNDHPSPNLYDSNNIAPQEIDLEQESDHSEFEPLLTSQDGQAKKQHPPPIATSSSAAPVSPTTAATAASSNDLEATSPVSPASPHEQEGTVMKNISNFISPNDNDDESRKKGHGIALNSILLTINISAWYWTNGMNGISMQSYSGQVVKDPNFNTSTILRLLDTVAVTTFITFLQLLFGAIIGRCMLLFLNPNITWAHISSTHWLPLSVLHALGSLATNLGFMYGKASLVQLIKLLEPFETLLLSQLLFQEGNCAIGIVSAMMVVVGAAMSLLKLQPTPPVPQAIIFAIISGLTLSCRNVLQRKHHHTNHTNVQSSMEWSKLEKSVVQFTQLSFFSAIWTGVASSILFFIIRPHFLFPSFQVLLWHPLYNIFSMITLGFCSALTHSLLNAGKRVFAICMAMLWFAEGLNAKTLAGLFLVGVGGSWYSWECKRKKTLPGTTSVTTNKAGEIEIEASTPTSTTDASTAIGISYGGDMTTVSNRKKCGHANSGSGHGNGIVYMLLDKEYYKVGLSFMVLLALFGFQQL